MLVIDYTCTVSALYVPVCSLHAVHRLSVFVWCFVRQVDNERGSPTYWQDGSNTLIRMVQLTMHDPYSSCTVLLYYMYNQVCFYCYYNSVYMSCDCLRHNEVSYWQVCTKHERHVLL